MFASHIVCSSNITTIVGRDEKKEKSEIPASPSLSSLEVKESNTPSEVPITPVIVSTPRYTTEGGGFPAIPENGIIPSEVYDKCRSLSMVSVDNMLTNRKMPYQQRMKFSEIAYSYKNTHLISSEEWFVYLDYGCCNFKSKLFWIWFYFTFCCCYCWLCSCSRTTLVIEERNGKKIRTRKIKIAQLSKVTFDMLFRASHKANMSEYSFATATHNRRIRHRGSYTASHTHLSFGSRSMFSNSNMECKVVESQNVSDLVIVTKTKK